MTDRRPERRHATPVAGTPTAPISGEFPRGARAAAAAVTRPDLPRYNPASPTYQKAAPPAPLPPASRPGGPRRHPTIEMPSFRPPEPPPSGRMLDDALGFELDLDADGGLEIDCLPSTHKTRVEQPRQSTFDPPPSAARPITQLHMQAALDRPPPSRPGGADRPPPSSRSSNRGMRAVDAPPPSTPRGSAAITQAQPAHDKHAAIVAFSGFGDAPTRIVAMPGYALRVMRRKRILRAELARAKARGARDVGLYEAALRAADDTAVRHGISVIVMAVILASLLAATAHQVYGVFLR